MTELTQLEEAYGKYDHFFVTFRRLDTEQLSKKERVYFVADPKRNPLKLFYNSLQSLCILLKERPKVIITTGAGVSVPLCILSKLFLAKIIFIDSFCRTEELSGSGKTMYKFADIFLVQWEGLIKKYKKAIYTGAVF